MKSFATYSELLAHITTQLNIAGIESSQAESEIILAEVLGCNRSELIKYHQLVPSLEAQQRIADILLRRTQREPLQYILGYVWFRDIILKVTPAVLIPRPETEILVEYVIQNAPHGGSVLDLGTGNGAIALALAHARPDLHITAVDISTAALTVAKENRRDLGLDHVELLRSNLFSRLTERKFNVITANLPYISEPEFFSLQPEIKEYEPKLALTADTDGLTVIRDAIANCANHLTPDGFTIFEIGETQADAVSLMFKNTCNFTSIKEHLDYHRRRRFVTAHLAI